MAKKFIVLAIESVTNYELRFEDHGGRQHIVVPGVILVEGVHNGSAGPLYYSPDELARAPGIWNGVPVTINHPEGEAGMTSANDPAIMRDWVVGILFNVHYDPDIRGIRVELWVDVGRCRRISPGTLARIRNRERIEVSTGLWFDLVGGYGVWNGEEFVGTVINMNPDHLAILPDVRGACSIEDGCGIGANKRCHKSGTNTPCCKTGGMGGDEDMFQVNVRSTARRPKFNGTESTTWSAPSWGDIVRGYNRVADTDISQDIDVADAPQTLKRWAAGLSLLGDENANDLRNLVFFPVVNPANENLNERALRAVIGGRGSSASIPETARESAQAMARDLLNSEFDAGLEVQSESEEETDMHKTAVNEDRIAESAFQKFLGMIKGLIKEDSANEGIPEGAVVLSVGNAQASKDEIVKALALTGNQVGMREIHEALQVLADALDERTPTSTRLNIVEEIFMDNTFIMRVFTHRENGPSTMEFFKGSFVADGEGVPTGINDDMIQVRERREFVEMKEEETVPGNKGAGDGDTHNESDEEEDDLMNKEEMVNSIIACGKNGFGEDDRGSLLAMEEDVLTKMAPKADNQGDPPCGETSQEGDGEGKSGGEGEGTGNQDEPGDGSDDGAGEGEGGSGEGEGEGSSSNEGQEGEGEGSDKEEVSDVVAFLKGKDAPPDMIEATQESIRVLKEEKDGIIKAIMENDANAFSEEMLLSKDIFDLRNISVLMKGKEESTSAEELKTPVSYIGSTAGNIATKKKASASGDASKPMGRVMNVRPKKKS